MKKYTIGLITGALLAVSTMMFMGAQNKNLGHITADSIELVSPFGKTIIMGGGVFTENTDGKQTTYLGGSEGGVGFISTFNADGKETANIGTNVEGGDGYLRAYNSDGKQIVYLGTNVEGGGFLQTSNADGKGTVTLGSYKGYGIIRTFNTHGVNTGYFGTNNKNDGTAILYDRYGDEGWSAFGKQ